MMAVEARGKLPKGRTLTWGMSAASSCWTRRRRMRSDDGMTRILTLVSVVAVLLMTTPPTQGFSTVRPVHQGFPSFPPDVFQTREPALFSSNRNEDDEDSESSSQDDTVNPSYGGGSNDSLKFPPLAEVSAYHPDDNDIDIVAEMRNQPTPAGFLTPDQEPLPLIGQTFALCGTALAAVWTILSVKLLTVHPDPKFANLPLVHNLLTIAQALAFGLPLLTGTVLTLVQAAQRGGWKALEDRQHRQLNLSLLSMAVYLTVALRNLGAFTFGHGTVLLVPDSLAKRLTVPCMLTAGALYGIYQSSLENVIEDDGETPAAIQYFWQAPGRILGGLVDSVWQLLDAGHHKTTTTRSQRLYATTTVLFAFWTLFPVAVAYPAATLPSVLGQRMCRLAPVWYGMATTASHTLWNSNSQHPMEWLRRGLRVASGGHLTLLALKFLGVDGGGWAFPGPGLQMYYPAMLAVPFWTSLSILTHILAVWATLSE